MKRSLALIALVVWGLALGCAREQAREPLRLATTTSVRDTGLLDVLEREFEQQTNIDLQAIAVGSGQALEMARRGDADVLIAHSPEAEEKFMADGHGVDRRPLMTNDFLLLGPADDPAGAAGKSSVVEAMRAIADAKSLFISRGDESGTHKREEELWQKADVTPDPTWRLSAGAGMAAVLGMAVEKSAYTLCDRGTFLAQKPELKIIHEGDPLLINHYSVIVVKTPDGGPNREAAARAFADFLTSPEIQKTIGDFRREEFGQSLFTPANQGS